MPESATVTGAKMWRARPIESVYIPVKEMLSNAPGFGSLYAQREIHFEEVYADILDRAYRPPHRGPIDQNRKDLLRVLQQHMEGKIISGIRDNHNRGKIGDFLKEKIKPDSKLSFVSAFFTIYA
ncbi:MAG: hypothetical protein IH892_12225, partial [Planctomycetes bacterium]|nr:hypothetical protein [Planctomycetota bacterium]